MYQSYYLVNIADTTKPKILRWLFRIIILVVDSDQNVVNQKN